MVNVFKAVLLFGVLGLGYLILFRTEQRLVHRILAVILGICMCVFVIAPNLSTRIASFLGIGRGADFIFYLSNFLIYYLLALEYIAIQKLERRLIVLARSDSLRRAEPPDAARP